MQRAIPLRGIHASLQGIREIPALNRGVRVKRTAGLVMSFYV